MAQKKTRKIELPSGFDAIIEKDSLIIKSQKGELKKKLHSKEIKVRKENNSIVLETESKKRTDFAVLNSFEKQIENMVKGLEKEFEFKLSIVYSHFPINIAVKSNVVEINNFLGEKLPRIAKIIPNAKIEIKGKEIFVRGHDKEAVGQTAANIEKATKVFMRDRRVFQDGIYLVKK